MERIPIKRVAQTTDQTAPWDGVVFTHEVGSDELGEALKACYPHHRTLRQRKYAAIIQFLTDEINESPLGNTSQSSIQAPHTSSRPEDSRVGVQSLVQLQRSLSAAHSPANSDCPSVPQVRKGGFAAPSSPATRSLFVDPTAATHSSQFIFNAVDGRTIQQKSKRKMTAEERVEYKETRKRGACCKCKRSKGKCNHTIGMEVQSSSPISIADDFKRRISLGLDSPDTNLSKTPRLQQTPNEGSLSSEVGNHSNLHQQQTTNMSRRSSNTLMQCLLGPHSPRWSDTVSEGSQPSIPGYVHPSHSYEQRPGNFFNDQAPSYWSNPEQELPDCFHNVSSFQSGPNLEDSQDGPVYHEFPSIHIHGPGQDVYPMADYSPFGQWILDQHPPLGDTTPT